MLTISILYMIAGGIFAFLGKVLQIIQQYVQDDLLGWVVCFYVIAGLWAVLAIIEFIFGFIRSLRRRLRGNAQQRKRK